MEQELMWMFEYFIGIGACTLMFFFMCVIVGIIIYVVLYFLWLLHIYATIRRRYRENLWWSDYDKDIEDLDNE